MCISSLYIRPLWYRDYRSYFICICLQTVSWRFLLNLQVQYTNTDELTSVISVHKALRWTLYHAWFQNKFELYLENIMKHRHMFNCSLYESKASWAQSENRTRVLMISTQTSNYSHVSCKLLHADQLTDNVAPNGVIMYPYADYVTTRLYNFYLAPTNPVFIAFHPSSCLEFISFGGMMVAISWSLVEQSCTGVMRALLHE